MLKQLNHATAAITFNLSATLSFNFVAFCRFDGANAEDYEVV